MITLLVVFCLQVYISVIVCDNQTGCYSLWPDSVQCQNDVQDIKNEFLILSKSLPNDQKHFKTLNLTAPVSELPENVFHDISFDTILISNAKILERIHWNAFNSTIYTLARYQNWQTFTTDLRNNPPEYDLYKAFSSLVNIQILYISLQNNEEHDIPDYAFRDVNGKQNSFTDLEFYGYFYINSIGNYVFYNIPNLSKIVFKHTIIRSISSNAFDFGVQSDKNLSITFSNTSINENCFESGIFLGSKRPLQISFEYNRIQYIEEAIFGPFFELNKQNSVNFRFNPLKCDDIQPFNWLLKMKSHLEKQVLGAVCDNGTNLWDLTYQQEPDMTTEANASTHQSSTQSYSFTHSAISTQPDIYTETSTIRHFSTIIYYTARTDISIPSSTSKTNISNVTDILDTTESDTTESDVNTESEIEDILNNLQTLIDSTESSDSLNNFEELLRVLNLLKDLQTSVDSLEYDLEFDIAFKLSSSFLKVFSNLINQKHAWMSGSINDKSEAASQILIGIQSTAFTLSCTQNISNQLTEISNPNMFVNTFHRNVSQEIFFESNSTSIIIPEGIGVNKSNNCENSAFGAVIQNLESYLINGKTNKKLINSEILAFSLINGTESNQIEGKNNIKISLKHKKQLLFGDRMVCVFWDFKSMMWSSNGCSFMSRQSNRSYTVCECNHLTNFAALMDISGREDDNETKSILTTIFCSISIISLILTVLILFINNKKRTNTITDKLVKTRNTITINLCLCLIIADLIIVFGMDRTGTKWLCQTLSAVLLYSLLASFSWMLLEGFHLYRMTVHIFSSESQLIQIFCFGYGIPIVIVFIAFITIWFRENILFEALIGDYFCWISSTKHPNNIWIFAAPALTTIFVNSILMYILLTKIWKSEVSNDKLEKRGSGKNQIFGITSLLFNLGITWSLFILYVQQFGYYFSYFSYAFIVLNGSQGFFIFVYHLMIQINHRKRVTRNSIRTTQTR